MPSAYVFEIKSVQAWLFAGGKLRDAVGGSALIDELCAWEGDDLVAVAARASGLTEAGFLRRAGGGLIVTHASQAALERFRAVWTALLARRAPGLGFEDAIGEAGDAAAGTAERQALAAARGELGKAQLRLPDPLRANPFVALAPRTGRPALAEPCRITQERQDPATRARRAYLEREDDRVGRKFLEGDAHRWPVELTVEDREERRGTSRGDNPVFPFLGDNRTVGLMHADANGLGQILVELSARGVEGAALRALSRAVAAATTAAAREATRKTLLEHDKDGVLPARPILLGGDDITIILRGDRAIPFAERYLAAFARETRARFAELKREHGSLDTSLVADGLSAGAGIAFIKARQPFARAHELGASLADHAKSTAKAAADGAAIPSLLAFHRVTTPAIAPDYGEVVERELASVTHQLTANPYRVSAEDGAGAGNFPALADLAALKDSFAEAGMARGPVRRITGELLAGEWERPWQRMLEVAEREGVVGLEAFKAAMARLGCADRTGAPVPWREDGGTPLLDALSWRAAEKGAEA